MSGNPKYWVGQPPAKDDFGEEIINVFVDGKTITGPWAFMTPASWVRFGVGELGPGRGQKYEKQEDGRWLKVDG